VRAFLALAPVLMTLSGEPGFSGRAPAPHSLEGIWLAVGLQARHLGAMITVLSRCEVAAKGSRKANRFGTDILLQVDDPEVAATAYVDVLGCRSLTGRPA
jgi:hypothetical protein